jgi:hypothetical protein
MPSRPPPLRIEFVRAIMFRTPIAAPTQREVYRLYFADDLHRPRARIVSGLGQALAGQGKFADAEPVVIEGFSTLMANRKILRGDTTLMAREALDAVVQFYRAAGKPEKAEEWERKKAEL